MKATDLMVGDWVMCNGLKLRVASITDKVNIGFRDNVGEIYWAEDGLDRIDPIPLTEEILVKNGWRKQTMLYKNEWYGDIGLFEEHGEFYYMEFKFEYVHQIQHALRLMGIEKEIEL